MIWTTWRQHRPEALTGIAVLAAVITLLLAAYAYHGFSEGSEEERPLRRWMTTTLATLPGLTGIFVGAPLLSRDIEQHTHRLVWTQGTPRARWLAVKLLLVFAAVLAAASVVGGLESLLLRLQDASVQPWDWFDLQGPIFVAYTAFGLGLGLVAGAVIGRSYPAMALTLVLFVVARWLVSSALRPRYLEPLQGTYTAPPGLFALPPGVENPWVLDIDFDRHVVTYQPLERYWLLHGIETAVFFALAVLLVGLAVYWVARWVR